MWKTHTNRRGKNWVKETASRLISPEKEPPTRKKVQPQSGARKFFNEHNVLDFLPNNPDSQRKQAPNGQKEIEVDKTNNAPLTEPKASNASEEPEASKASNASNENTNDGDHDDSDYDSDDSKSSDDTDTMGEDNDLLELLGYMQRDVKCNRN